MDDNSFNHNIFLLKMYNLLSSQYNVLVEANFDLFLKLFQYLLSNKNFSHNLKLNSNLAQENMDTTIITEYIFSYIN